MNKKQIVNRIVEDIEANFYGSKELIMSLVKENLNGKTVEELKDFYQLE